MRTQQPKPRYLVLDDNSRIPLGELTANELIEAIQPGTKASMAPQDYKKLVSRIGRNDADTLLDDTIVSNRPEAPKMGRPRGENFKPLFDNRSFLEAVTYRYRNETTKSGMLKKFEKFGWTEEAWTELDWNQKTHLLSLIRAIVICPQLRVPHPTPGYLALLTDLRVESEEAEYEVEYTHM
jgi:hypothetical protein